eukprot:5127430-Pyramimonas_sp.AAC.1
MGSYNVAWQQWNVVCRVRGTSPILDGQTRGEAQARGGVDAVRAATLEQPPPRARRDPREVAR